MGVQEGFNQTSKYKGPFWTVLDPEYFKNNKSHRQSKLLRWVCSYELFWRPDYGRCWNTLGIFHGNDDSTSERAHKFPVGELRCRYIRFVPKECRNGGAMRIGIYGYNTENKSQREESSRGEEGKLEEKEEEHRITLPTCDTPCARLSMDLFHHDYDKIIDWWGNNKQWFSRKQRRDLRKYAKEAAGAADC